MAKLISLLTHHGSEEHVNKSRMLSVGSLSCMFTLQRWRRAQRLNLMNGKFKSLEMGIQLQGRSATLITTALKISSVSLCSDGLCASE